MAGALGIIVINVVARYVFDEGRIELEELQWHLYSVGFLFGMSYAYQADTHIRVDVLHERMPQATASMDRAVRYFAVLVAVYCPDFDLQRALRDLILRTQRGLSLPWRVASALAD